MFSIDAQQLCILSRNWGALQVFDVQANNMSGPLPSFRGTAMVELRISFNPFLSYDIFRSLNFGLFRMHSCVPVFDGPTSKRPDPLDAVCQIDIVGLDLVM